MGIFGRIKSILVRVSEEDVIEAEERVDNGVSVRNIISFLRRKGHSDKKIKSIVIKAINDRLNVRITQNEAKISALNEEEKELRQFDPLDHEVSNQKKRIKVSESSCVQIISNLAKQKKSMLSEVEVLLK
jgi:hypothetical protein